MQKKQLNIKHKIPLQDWFINLRKLDQLNTMNKSLPGLTNKNQIEDNTATANVVWPIYPADLLTNLSNCQTIPTKNETTQTSCKDATHPWKQVFELYSNRREQSQQDGLDPNLKILDPFHNISISVIKNLSDNGRAHLTNKDQPVCLYKDHQ